MRFPCPPASDSRSRAEEAERPQPAPAAAANPRAALAHPQPAQAEGRLHGTRTALLPAREVRSAPRRRQAERPLPVLQLSVTQARARFPREPSPQPALGLRSRAAALGSAWADRWSPAAEHPVAADIHTRAARPYPHDRVAR